VAKLSRSVHDQVVPGEDVERVRGVQPDGVSDHPDVRVDPRRIASRALSTLARPRSDCPWITGVEVGLRRRRRPGRRSVPTPAAARYHQCRAASPPAPHDAAPARRPGGRCPTAPDVRDDQMPRVAAHLLGRQRGHRFDQGEATPDLLLRPYGNGRGSAGIQQALVCCIITGPTARRPGHISCAVPQQVTDLMVDHVPAVPVQVMPVLRDAVSPTGTSSARRRSRCDHESRPWVINGGTSRGGGRAGEPDAETPWRRSCGRRTAGNRWPSRGDRSGWPSRSRANVAGSDREPGLDLPPGIATTRPGPGAGGAAGATRKCPLPLSLNLRERRPAARSAAEGGPPPALLPVGGRHRRRCRRGPGETRLRLHGGTWGRSRPVRPAPQGGAGAHDDSRRRRRQAPHHTHPVEHPTG
jgi:hypothetical protein